MPPLDREPRPWPSSSSKSRAQPVFPALKRVQRRPSSGEKYGKVGVKQTTHLEKRASPLVSPDDIFGDDTPPIPEKSALRSIGNQPRTPRTATLREEDQVTATVTQRNDGQPLWPYPTSPPTSPPPDPQSALTPQQLTSKTPSPLLAKADKGTSAERSRQARSTEDDRLVEDARRSAAELMERVRQSRSEARTNMEKVLKQNKATREIRQTEKTTAVRAVVRKDEHSSKTLSKEKETSPYVQRGRTTEREAPRRRNLIITDSPKPHVGGKLSASTNGKTSTASSSSKAKSATVPSRIRGSARPIIEVAPKSAVSKTKAAILTKQRSREIQPLQRTRGPRKAAANLNESMTNRRVDKKLVTAPTAQKRASASSPDELVVTDGQEAVLQQDDIASNDSPCEIAGSGEAPEYSFVDTMDRSQNSSEEEKVVSAASQVKPKARTGSSSWVVPVYRPKTRVLPTRPRPTPPQPCPKPKLAVDFAQSEEQMKGRRAHSHANTIRAAALGARIETSEPKSSVAPLLANAPFAGISESTASLYNSDQFKRNVASLESAPKSAAGIEPGCNEFSAEQMSPIDLSKLCSSHLTRPDYLPLNTGKATFDGWNRTLAAQDYPWNLKEDISGSLELGSGEAELHQAESWRKHPRFLEGRKATQTQPNVRLDAEIHSFPEFHSKAGVDLLPVPFDSTLKIDKLALEFQPGDTSPAKRPIKELKHKRKAVSTVQWHGELPIRLKSDITQKDASENASRNDSGMNEKKSEAENSNARNSYQSSGDIPELSSSIKLQPMPKAALSCLTNSHRGQKLHVSFASPPEKDLLANFTAVGPEGDPEKESEQIFTPSSRDANCEVEGYAPPHRSILSRYFDERVAPCNEPGAVPSKSARVYTQHDYEKAKRGLRKAIATGRLLLEPSYATSTTPAGEPHKVIDNQLDDAVRFILEVKMRLPEDYSEFARLLETCRTEQITPDQAKHVDTQVAKLFAGTPDLLEGFKRFRPAENDSEDITTAKSDTVYAMGITSEVQDDKREDEIGTQLSRDSKTLQEKQDPEKQIESNHGVDSISRLIASLRDSARASSIGQLTDSLRDSARAFGKQPGENDSLGPSRSKTGSLKWNPEAPEFKPLSEDLTPPGTVFSMPVSNKFVAAFPQTHQIRYNGPNKPGPIFARGNVTGELHAMGYRTMPAKSNIYREALKRDLAAADNPHPIVLKTPITMNGTTYYSMPKHGLPVNTATALSGGGKNYRKDCRFAFWNPTTSSQRGPFPPASRNSRFAHDNQSDPLWMYTPLVPIRKGDSNGSISSKTPVAHGLDPSKGDGVEAKRLDDHIAKMKLDEFKSRFPMTGRKAQVVPNMKQKYAAEIQHRLELVLYEKKEKEAAAKKSSLL